MIEVNVPVLSAAQSKAEEQRNDDFFLSIRAENFTSIVLLFLKTSIREEKYNF